MHQGDMVLNTVIIQQVTGFIVIQAIYHDIHIAYNPDSVLRIQILSDWRDLERRIQGLQSPPGRLGFQFTHPIVAVQNLPVQIGELHPISVANPNFSHPRGCQVHRHRAAQSTSPCDKHSGMLKFFLTRLSPTWYQHLPVVAHLVVCA
jgi:hypothetical protein